MIYSTFFSNSMQGGKKPKKHQHLHETAENACCQGTLCLRKTHWEQVWKNAERKRKENFVEQICRMDDYFKQVILCMGDPELVIFDFETKNIVRL